MNFLKKLYNKLITKKVTTKTPKQLADEEHEPWVSVVGFEVDPENLSDGAFDLDWNDVFLAKLVKFGYRGKNDQEIVDAWFKDLCQSVASEVYEQEIADPEKRKLIQRKQLENGRVEHS